MLCGLVQQLGIGDILNQFYNLDEISVALDSKAQKCYYHCGSKNIQYIVQTLVKAMYTFLFFGNAMENICFLMLYTRKSQSY